MSSTQTPLNSGFNARTTTSDVIRGIDLKGRNVIITGGYAGIGLETTKALASAGAHVLIPVRSVEKAKEALKGIPNVEQLEMDLLNPQSIQNFAANFLARKIPLHILINNAGIMAAPLDRDGRGYESQFAANHLGHFDLTLRLLPALRLASGARVVSVSSRGHQIANVDLGDPNFNSRAYDRWQGYGQSKTANILFAVELDRLESKNGVRAFALHPGGIPTNLSRHMTEEEFKRHGLSRANMDGSIPKGLSVDEGGSLKRPEQGAATSVWCATSPLLKDHGGVYCEDSDISSLWKGDMTDRYGVAPYAIDPKNAEGLWSLSKNLVQ